MSGLQGQYGYDAWFLPSKDELNLMYNNLRKKMLGGFADAGYWSSSENSSSSYSAWSHGFLSGNPHDDDRESYGIVRPIRAF